MPKRFKKIGLGLVAVGLSIVLLLTGAIPVCEAEPPGGKIKVGYRTAFTGPIATQTNPFSAGAIDCAKYYNDYKGGINGIPIKIMWEDNHCERLKEISTHKRFKAAGAIAEVAFLCSTEVIAILQQRDEIPLVNIAGVAPGGTTGKPQWVVCGAPYWAQQQASSIRWIKENWTESRPVRVGGIVYEDPAGTSSVEPMAEYCAKIGGVEWIGYEVVSFAGCIDTSTELLRLAAKKADWIIYLLFGSPIVTVCKDAYRLELQKKGINFIGCVQTMDTTIARVAGADAVEGWYAWRGTAVGYEDLEGVIEMREAGKGYRGWEVEDVPPFYVPGWAGSIVLFEGLRLALEKVGIDNLTGRAVRDGIASMRDFDVKGIMFGPATITEECPCFVRYLVVYQMQQGKTVRVSEPVLVVPADEVGLKW